MSSDDRAALLTRFGRLAGDVLARFKGRTLTAVVLSLLVAATESLGILVIIPLLAIAGITAAGATAPLLAPLADVPGLSNVYAATAIFLLLVGARQLLVYLQNTRSTALTLDFINSLRAQLVDAVAAAGWKHLTLGRLDRQIQILTLDVNRIGETVRTGLSLTTVLMLLAGQLCIAVLLSPQFTAIGLLAILLSFLLLNRRLAEAGELGSQITDSQNSMFQTLANLMPALRNARLTGAVDALRKRFATQARAQVSASNDFVRHYEANRAFVQGWAAIVLAVCLLVAVEVLDLTALEILMLVLVFARIVPGMSRAIQETNRIAHTLPAYDHARAALATWRDRAQAQPEQVPLPRPRQSVALDKVSVSYPGRGANALHEVSVTLRPGETLLINGPSGAGKSTVACVLSGLLEPDQGALRVDGRVIGARHRQAWSGMVGYVDQEATLFTATLGENLSWDGSNVSPQAAEPALRAAQAWDLVARLPKGLDTYVGERASRVSGGERQRIAIAREILRSPHLLILDEATSGLDEDTERRVLNNLHRLLPHLMLVVISHRSSARFKADRTITVRDGRVAGDSDAPDRRDDLQDSDDVRTPRIA